MNGEMTVNEYQKLACRTINWDEADGTKLITNGVMGLCGEAGECSDIVKKHLFQGHELNRDKLIDELGDVSWYLAVTAYALDVPLNDIFEHNIDKLRKRYPDGFEADKSINREEYKNTQAQ